MLLAMKLLLGLMMFSEASALRLAPLRAHTLVLAPQRAAASQMLFGRTDKATAVSEKPGQSQGEEAPNEAKALMEKVKGAGKAGILSYIFWELIFWGASVPIALFGFRQLTGAWPDFSSQDDIGKLGAEAFAFVNFARFAVPLRIGLALSTTPWVQANIVDKFDVDNTEA
eukprot:scaffold70309_cov32-Tisochrysis_lutea.AAC.5